MGKMGVPKILAAIALLLVILSLLGVGFGGLNLLVIAVGLLAVAFLL